MSVKAITGTVLGAGVVGLLLPLFLPPAPVMPQWIAFIPYGLNAFGISIAKGRREQQLVLAVSLIAVSAGTWVYWDTMRFNQVFSWQDLGIVSSFVPFFQIAVICPVLACLCWQEFKHRKVNPPSQPRQ